MGRVVVLHRAEVRGALTPEELVIQWSFTYALDQRV